MNNNSNLLGNFLSYPSLMYDASEAEKIEAENQGDIFYAYIWGERGIDTFMKEIHREKYGNDLALILFKFIVNPLPVELNSRKDIDPFRTSEKSISVTIIAFEENFFCKSEAERYLFLKNEMLNRLELVTKTVKKRKLDTNMELLKFDLLKKWEEFTNRLQLF
jgi:hypothetical protein